jgi:hypothetical protein
LNPFLPLEILTIRHLLSTMSKNYWSTQRPFRSTPILAET